MDDPSTDSLRKMAPSWSLAGDDQLLGILQDTHQRLLSKCQEANCQLEQMATALDDASISLQNVNNQFMALSSRQFIESRVYDDDDLATDVPPVKEPSLPEIPDELSSLKHSLAVLESAHEIITIVNDSDTESDTDDEVTARMVLKPKDVYAERPLPYIIGSQPWRSKWHAGLVQEDSDSDSTASKVENDSDQYSASEPEDTHTNTHAHTHIHELNVPPAQDTTVSGSSSELPSEQGSVPKPTPSDVASEIARRLGAAQPNKMVHRDPEYEEPAQAAVRKIYRPQDPVSTRVFPESPPPLSDADSEDSDIFAELRRHPPTLKPPTVDLFDNQHESDDGDIFSDFATKLVTDPSAKPPSIFDAGPTPHMFDKHLEDKQTTIHNHIVTGDGRPKNVADKPQDRRVDERQDVRSDPREVKGTDEDRVKKPVGGISLFGNKGTESIGAAILKRNQRKPSTSGDESGSDSRSEAQEQQVKKEKDIFDDLFARSEAKKVTKDKPDFVKDIKTEIQKKTEEKVKKTEKAKVDLFSDNLFDDIDDIFSSNVVKMPSKNTKAKSIFEDDDDLFSEIAAPKPMKVEVASSSNNKKSLFDSDDELFSENTPKPKPAQKPKINAKATEINKNNNTDHSSKISETPKIEKEITRSIFDDDEDDIFSDVKTNKLSQVNKVQHSSISNDKYNNLSNNNEDMPKNIDLPKTDSNVFNSPSLFDDDDSDLFVEPAESTIVQNVTPVINKNIEGILSKTEENVPENKTNSIKIGNAGQTIVKNDVILNKESNKSIKNNLHEVTVINHESNDFVDENSSTVLHVNQNEDKENELTNKTIESHITGIADNFEKNTQDVEHSSSDTNDFSDQDFDDLPPKIEATKNDIPNTNVATESDSSNTLTGVNNIFDKNTLEDNIFSTTVKSETASKNTKPDFLESIGEEIKKTEQDNKNTMPTTKTIEADIFSDILTEPPVFEKPKEPKKSKNVNALFDDDSDDESLFFKKNDPIFEESPDNFIPKQDRLFGLFTDEPPDDGFSKISDDLDDDMFTTVPKPKLPQRDNIPPIPDIIDKDNEVPKTDNKILKSETVFSEGNTFNTLSENSEKTVIGTDKDSRKNTSKLETENIGNILPNLEEQKSATFLDDEKLFDPPKNESKTTALEKQDIFSNDDNLFSFTPKLDKPSTMPQPTQEAPINNSLENSDDELFNSLTKIENSVPESIENKKNIEKSDEELFKVPKKVEFVSKSETSPKSADVPATETKKVGKLKMGLNINVNALLPGASPKKVKPADLTDGQGQSIPETKKSESQINPESKKSEPNTPESQNTDSKLLKSVSFDGKPESDILDNKLSKERPRIQVKRRPSTRKARREAVRKSGIDFGEDSTDNSSSIDDPPRIQTENQAEISKKVQENTGKQAEAQDNQSRDQAKIETKSEGAAIQPEIQAKIESVTQPENVEKQPETTKNSSYPRDVKSKVVYILNDEDIFNTSPAEKPGIDNKPDENIGSTSGVTTLGQVYDKSETKSNKKDSKTSLFGDDNDEEIFKSKTAIKKTSIFTSDSEEDLFGTSNKEAEKVKNVEIKKEIKREVVKGPLFGDDDDDDDLFGVKAKKSIEQKPQASRPIAKETPKLTEPVFEDPLSMFGDDD